jgi:ubiquinone/menaquinone biosynthesis C-methylase UbiE
LKLLRRRFGNNPKIEYVLLDGYGLQAVPGGTIDAAFSYGVFVHLQHWDIFNYMSELRRVLKPNGKAIIQHANTLSQLGWKRFLHEVPASLNRHKLPGSFTVMTPELMWEFAQRAGLTLEDCLTEVVRRDCISLLRKAIW